MKTSPMISVLSTINSATFLQKAVALSTKLGLPYCPSVAKRITEVVLAYTENGLQLMHMPFGAKKPNILLFVDFVHGKSGYRLAQNRTTKQPLARAVGIKSGFRPTVFDATAGLGADGFVLASLGCHVTMCERSPVMVALLEDGIERAKENDSTREIVGNNLEFIQHDAIEYLNTTRKDYQTVYLDPMYPHRKQSALSKLALRAIRTLVGDDLDGASLLAASLKKAKNRTVVKRPRLASKLSAIDPSHVVSMKNSRFDVYMTLSS